MDTAHCTLSTIANLRMKAHLALDFSFGENLWAFSLPLLAGVLLRKPFFLFVPAAG